MCPEPVVSDRPSRRATLLPLVVALSLLFALLGCTSEPSDVKVEATPVSRVEEPTPASHAAALGLVEGWGPTSAELDQAAVLVAGLSTSQLAGQVIVSDWRGTGAPVALLKKFHLGGFIWFTDNIVSTAQVRQVNRRLRRAADRDWPLLLGIDQEGGVVERLSSGVTPLPSFLTAGAARNPGLTRRVAAARGRELRGLGLTANFAPVADVTIGPSDPTIGARAASSRPAQVAVQALAAARGLDDAGLIATLKHFPGHGSVTANSHFTLPRQHRRLSHLRRSDLRPFAEAVRAGASSVMVGHLDLRALDPGVPTSLSRPVVTGLLREDLGFEGLVVTDSLAMTAVTGSFSPARAAVQALRAGADVLLMPADVARAHAGIVGSVRRGDLPRRRLEQAAARQIALLLHNSRAKGAPPGSARRVALAWSRAAVTLTSGSCRGRLVGRRISPIGDPAAVAEFSRAARSLGLEVTRRGTRIAFLRAGGATPAAPVSVAVESPWVLSRVRSRVEVAAYGRTPAAMQAVAEVLVGKRRAPGSLPVQVAGVSRRGC